MKLDKQQLQLFSKWIAMKTIELILFNDGHWVALFESVSATTANGNYTNLERVSHLTDLINERFPEQIDVSCSLPYSLRGNESETIYQVTTSKDFESEFKKFEFVFRARSIYGDIVETNNGQLYKHQSLFMLTKRRLSNAFKKR
ncbi:hypothetical protein [Vibrio coralliilyticus]|uniref:hypothetical protein n=1 Tax=Vibrio coralliilyticus TaxID=190893 RepID=UPI00155FFB9A|nr:hypothetical protein [Vibrio coralliilyticus]NRF16101.1 hypothetical protein [Vibrio coralliilyticus]